MYELVTFDKLMIYLSQATLLIANLSADGIRPTAGGLLTACGSKFSQFKLYFIEIITSCLIDSNIILKIVEKATDSNNENVGRG